MTKNNEILNKYAYKGAIHIHSVFSDGTGNIEQITKAAKKAGLSWIVVSDHNNLEIGEGIFNGITVIKGEEISPEDENHYLALDIKNCISPKDDVKEVVEEVRQNGGFGFATHPDESENRKNPNKPIRWTDKNIVPDGIEIWNWFSQWADNYNESNILSIAYAFLFKNKLIKKPNKNSLEWWDKLNQNSKNIVPAIGGLDVHALKIKKYIIPVTIFPYKSMFKTITNQIFLDEPLSENFSERKKQILTALKKGKLLIINRSVNKKIPQFFIENKNGKACCGEHITLDLETFLHFTCYKNCDIKIFKDGQKYAHHRGKKYSIKINEAGKYRIEAEFNGKGYVYSNPIVVEG